MRLVMTLLVRDEADVVRENLDFHFSQGVDFAIVMDNRSRDGTREILSEYEARGLVRVMDEPGVYSQARWLTRMARIAVEEEGADWVLPNDADEFWLPSGGTLKEAVAGLPSDVGGVACPRVTFVPVPEDGRPWWERMTLRQRASVDKLHLPLRPKWIHRARPGLEISIVHRPASPAAGTSGRLGSVEVLHFQMRTYAQFEHGVIVRGGTLKGAATPKERFNRNRRREYRLWREGRLEEYYAREVAGEPSDELVEDTRLRDHLRALGPRPAPPPPRADIRTAIARAKATPFRLRAAVRRAGSRPPGDPVPFVVGAPRSGTTLLRAMLDAHPQLAIPAETHFIPMLVRRWCKLEAAGAGSDELCRMTLELIVSHRRWADLGLDAGALAAHLEAIRPLRLPDAVRCVHVVKAREAGKPRWGDSTPGYSRRLGLIRGVVSEARFIHVIRDGRDLTLPPAGLGSGPRSVEDAARLWRQRTMGARRKAARLPPHCYTEVRYEALVSDPRPALGRLSRFLDLPFDEAMLGHEAEPAERWRTEMEPADARVFEGSAGGLLEELGYELAGA
ncbi:MAG: sulfotransferase [Solirubrobacterales bacterium]